MTTPVLHWFLPTGGDARTLATGAHGDGVGSGQSLAQAERPATLEYLTQIAQAAESLGYDAVLTPTGSHCADAWIVTSALMSVTRRLRFLVAFRPGLIEPVLAAAMAASFDRLSGGRVLLNVVAGGSDAEQRGYGDHADHDTRYQRAEEFLQVVRRAWTGEEFDHQGEFFRIEGGRLREPPLIAPDLYFGGSSPAALNVAGAQADCYLTWGEPPDAVARKVDAVRAAAEPHGRKPRFGLRIHVITRDTERQAWADASRLLEGLDQATVTARQEALAAMQSEGQRRMQQLHGGDLDRLVVGPNLWAGIGLVRGGAGTALVGSHEQVAERIAEYQQAGIEEFILSGYPHLEEAYAVAEGVRPLLA